MRLPFLILHISAGIVGLISGAFAMTFRKGSERHRMAGDIFVVAMLTMGLCGSYLALLKHQTNNVFGGLLTFYLITTAWLSGKQRDEGPGIFDWGALAMALAIGTSLFTLGVRVMNGQAEGQAGVPIGMYFFMGSIPLLAAVGDVRVLARGGISGRPRLVRHLWRMCFGLFIATGSFFLGQQQVFPAALRKQYILAPLAILPLFLLIYWVVRVKFSARWRILIVPTYEKNLAAQQASGD
ncbi:MAG: DUF2306 domain-containing protein [Candidatus Sulfotelmatobacter sp.]